MKKVGCRHQASDIRKESVSAGSVLPPAACRLTPYGFTLIELLVVVAIISMLVMVVLTGLSYARGSARNSERLAQVRQYLSAFEQYQVNNASYPGGSVATARYCLGDRSTGTCYQGLYNENATLNAEVATVITPPPAGTDVNVPYTGYVYSCTAKTGNFCNGYDLIWFMEGTNQSCGPGFRLSGDQNGATWCQYVQCGLNSSPVLIDNVYVCS